MLNPSKKYYYMPFAIAYNVFSVKSYFADKLSSGALWFTDTKTFAKNRKLIKCLLWGFYEYKHKKGLQIFFSNPFFSHSVCIICEKIVILQH